VASESSSYTPVPAKERKRSGLWDKQEPQVTANDMFQELGLKIAAAQPGHKAPAGQMLLPPQADARQAIANTGFSNTSGGYTLLPKGAVPNLPNL
jgi:hypothetical protein